MACSPADYDYLRQLVLSMSANVVDPSRDRLFDSRLAPLARLSGAACLEDLVRKLRLQTHGQLHRMVAEAMTINETSFFRDLRPFEVLRSEVLPAIIDRQRKQRALRIWSAASATGQEAYSVAMLLREHFPELSTWDVRILGTDISTPVLSYARAGRYRRLEVNRGLPARLLVKYFVRFGEEWEILPEIRNMCEFRQMNLCAMLPTLPAFDLILLRNVMIYFTPQDRSALLGDVDRVLAPHGALLLGHAEQTEDITDSFDSVLSDGAFYYRKADFASAHLSQGVLDGKDVRSYSSRHAERPSALAGCVASPP